MAKPGPVGPSFHGAHKARRHAFPPARTDGGSPERSESLHRFDDSENRKKDVDRRGDDGHPPTSDGLHPSSFLLLVVMPGATSY